ncbi:hypothetical protein JM18_000814 [Phytophthora kernoviae]|uniref:Choline/carnitine acyltransferase domain-containing protein n=2 Tax=Phytophthora kernoviae TaxID=325452 RepID=A0A922AT24_9STRA|nr:hypothetical protein G195_002405 [Phytophthora kernoviae 00238/432]KAG2532960.1 hypothetical protein JM18_000814 [Phytophthora kernoviae]
MIEAEHTREEYEKKQAKEVLTLQEELISSRATMDRIKQELLEDMHSTITASQKTIEAGMREQARYWKSICQELIVEKREMARKVAEERGKYTALKAHFTNHDDAGTDTKAPPHDLACSSGVEQGVDKMHLSTHARSLSSAGSAQQPGWFNRMLTTNEYNLPRLPVPQLEETVQRYLESVKPLVSEKDWETHAALAKNFQGAEGRQLQEMLLKRELKQAMGRSYPFSYIEGDWDKMYLGGRYQSPINVNPSYGLLDETDGNLAGMMPRSAAFVRSMVKWWTKVKTSELEQDKNQCMAGFARQFGTAKVPKKGIDVLTSNPRANHIVVMKGNQYYRLNVLSPDGKQLLSQKELETQLDSILNTSSKGDHDDLDLSTLTAEERDTWAQIRDELVAHHPVNAETLEVIDSALFMLVLEDQSPTDMKQRMELSLHGQGSHRWFDKVQVMVQPDGHLTVNFEHSFSDGTVWNRWLHECWHDMRGSDSGFSPLEELPEYTGATKPEKLSWKLSNNLVEDVKKAEDHFADFSGNLNSEYLVYNNFAKNNCKQWKLSPDGIAQMALQLAFYRTHSKIAPTYESCSTRVFHHGRTETIRSATPAAEAFVKSVEAGAPVGTQRELLIGAVNRHVEMAKMAQKGLGVDRHLTALNSIASQNDVPSEFLASPVRAESTNFLVSSSNVTMPFLQYFSFGAVVPHGYGVGYLLHNKSINVSLTNYKDSGISDGKKFKKALEGSLDTIKALADSPAP